jgi:hypothetical protein
MAQGAGGVRRPNACVSSNGESRKDRGARRSAPDPARLQLASVAGSGKRGSLPRWSRSQAISFSPSARWLSGGGERGYVARQPPRAALWGAKAIGLLVERPPRASCRRNGSALPHPLLFLLLLTFPPPSSFSPPPLLPLSRHVPKKRFQGAVTRRPPEASERNAARCSDAVGSPPSAPPFGKEGRDGPAGPRSELPFCFPLTGEPSPLPRAGTVGRQRTTRLHFFPVFRFEPDNCERIEPTGVEDERKNFTL